MNESGPNHQYLSSNPPQEPLLPLPPLPPPSLERLEEISEETQSWTETAVSTWASTTLCDPVCVYMGLS